MRKPVKIVVGVVGAVVLVVVGVFIAAMVSAYRHSLPSDSPRVVETDDYRFDAPDRWITTCEDRAPGCLAVLASDYQWNDREYWIEAEQMADQVEDDAFIDSALGAAAAIAIADGGKPDDLTREDGKFLSFVGGARIDVTHAASARVSRSRFVQLRHGKMLRFTCYGEQSGSEKAHDDTCSAPLDKLQFPAAAAAENQAWEELAAFCDKHPTEDGCDEQSIGPGTSDPTTSFSIEKVTRLWGQLKKDQEAFDKQRAAAEAQSKK